MEAELRTHLFALRDAYCRATGAAPTTVAQQACGDWRFFERVGDEGKTFTLRIYDRAVQWFADRWPSDPGWPAGVARPDPTSTTDLPVAPAQPEEASAS